LGFFRYICSLANIGDKSNKQRRPFLDDTNVQPLTLIRQRLVHEWVSTGASVKKPANFARRQQIAAFLAVYDHRGQLWRIHSTPTELRYPQPKPMSSSSSSSDDESGGEDEEPQEQPKKQVMVMKTAAAPRATPQATASPVSTEPPTTESVPASTEPQPQPPLPQPEPVLPEHTPNPEPEPEPQPLPAPEKKQRKRKASTPLKKPAAKEAKLEVGLLSPSLILSL